jgi:hypothetical protein
MQRRFLCPGRSGPKGVALVLAAALTFPSCVAHGWRPVALTDIAVRQEHLPERSVRLLTRMGWLDLEPVTGVAFPFLEGRPRSSPGEALLDLRTVTRLAEVSARGALRTISAPDPQSLALVGLRVRFETEGGPVVLDVTGQEYPIVRGHPRECEGSRGQEAQCTGVVRVDLREVKALEVRATDIGKSVGVTLLAVGGTLAVLAVIVALTKESCPFVYADNGDGLRLVGEAYAGAAFRSLQRDDVLPLPSQQRSGSYRVVLRNEARETQYTDRAELLVAEHLPGERVLSAFDGRLLAVGAPRPPAGVVDFAGRSRLAEVALAGDERLWTGDLEHAVRAARPPLREGLVARFDDAPEQPVLELVAGNTPWLDLVFGRFFASMGTSLAVYQARWNDPQAGPNLLGWKEREGVDLRVDLRVGDDWQRVAVIPTVGPMALREIAVPLPATRTGAALEVRVSGGTGFWRVDSLRLSDRLVDEPRVRRLTPARATAADGSDAREVLAVSDGRYHALARMDESLDLGFDLPPLESGSVRSLFLSSNGYYNVHPPIQGRHSPETVRVIQQDPGGLGRFSLALAAQYLARSEHTRPLPVAGRQAAQGAR